MKYKKARLMTLPPMAKGAFERFSGEGFAESFVFQARIALLGVKVILIPHCIFH